MRLLLLVLLVGCSTPDGPGGWEPQAGPTFEFGTTLRPFTWEGEVSWVGDGLRAQPGGSWAIDYALDVDLSRHEAKHGAFQQLIVAVQAIRRHDEQGLWQAGMGTIAITDHRSVTGMPIERFNGWPTLLALHGRDGTPFEAVRGHGIHAIAAVHRLEGQLQVDLPPDTPPGWYEPRVTVWVRVAGASQPVLVDNFGDNANTQDEQLLPLVEVGAPAPPRLPVALATDRHFRGQVGTLSIQDEQTHALVGRAGFPRHYVVLPDRYDMGPAFPTQFPERIISPVDGGFDVIPELVRSYLDPSTLTASLTLNGAPASPTEARPGPDGELRPGGPAFDHRHGGFVVDLSTTGDHRVHMDVSIQDLFGRTFVGGGDYVVTSAMPLSFSTSVKPGTPFLVGETYPAKVNVNPAFPATISVQVDYYPNSDPERRRSWFTDGQANRFGHFLPYATTPLTFDEPGEYVSHLVARHVDVRGVLWMGDQVSSNVVAPAEPGILHLHGTRSPPHNLHVGEAWMGGKQRFEGRVDARAAFLPFKPGQIPDTFAPYHVSDTLYVQANGFKENIIEPHLSIAVDDPELAARLQAGHTRGTVLPPPTLQLSGGDWDYLEDVVQISADSAAWFPATPEHLDELPAAPLGDGRWHPFNFPAGNTLDAHLYLGVVRPGFPVMTSAFETDAIGLYWLASPNRFGYHYNTSRNGDLIGDFYRIQAGVVLRDHETGLNHYDAYASGITVVPDTGATTAIRGPGDGAMVTTWEGPHRIFVGQDSHDALDVGETMYLGGMVAPAVECDVRWTVTKPSGVEVAVVGRSSRIGIVRGKPGVPVDEPGVYRVKTDMQYDGLHGDTVGTAQDEFFHFAVPIDAESILRSSVGAIERIDPEQGLEIPLFWPGDVEDPRLWFGVLMPGRVLDQGYVDPNRPGFEYRFAPQQVAVQHSNYDARNFATGDWEVADTVVFQFFLEGTRDGKPVYDALRLALRGDQVYNYAALTARSPRTPAIVPGGGGVERY